MSIQVFDSPEEMFEQLRRDRENADRHIQPWQRELKPGDYVVRITEQFGQIIVIYGKLLDPLESERPYYNLDDPEEAAMFRDVEERFGEAWHRSFRFGRFYSPMCMQGEIGDVHLATISGVISEAQFEEARQQGWPQDLAIYAVRIDTDSDASERN
jgi:hypothetical protein